MSLTLRELLDEAVTSGTASLPNKDDGGRSSVPLSLEMVVQLWATHRSRMREQRHNARTPDRILVSAESGDETRAVLQITNNRYEVDASGRVVPLCMIPDCSGECLGVSILRVCAYHLDHPGHTPTTVADDPAALFGARADAWHDKALAARDAADKDLEDAKYHVARASDGSRAVVPAPAAPTGAPTTAV
ncbi:hypothetical protein AB0O91_36880 [Kitasatospora sp. NPDC089797]|uniref:hypothetical protein n=1 Tax=Kitasatospora sp. NPDC089797 TaxID=3155298 RepID=UPI003441712E